MKKQLMILLLLLSSAISQATTYYVSSSGLDSNNGTSSATPFKTIDKVNSLVLVAGDHVLFKRGDSFSGTLSLTESGTSGNLITFGAYGTGDNPEITGFTAVTSWTNLGLNVWESTNTVSALSNCNMVTIGSVNTPMGRTPNEGTYYTFQSHSGSTSITSSNLTGTPNWTGAEAVMRMGQFKWDRRVITSQSASTINWTTATSYTPKDNFGFFIQNDVRTLDVQNEWYYNPTTQKIRVYSTSQPTNFKLSTIDNLCNISASYIKIENISFTGANSYAIWGDVFGTVRSNVTIQNCSFNFIGITSIYGLKCNSYLIDNNSFNNCNNKAIQLGYATGITVSNNTINNTAVYEGMATSMWSSIHAISATDLIIEYNRIINSGFSGICYGSGVNNIIRYNFIDGFCKKLDDGGGIYGGTNGVVSNNVIVNGLGFPETTDLSFPTIAAGIYHDAGSSNIVVSNNSVGNCSYAGIFCNGNVNMVVEDNTVFNSSTYQLRLTAWNDKDYTVNRNKLVCRDASQMAMFINSGENDIPSKYTGNNNYFASPVGTANLFYVEQPSNSSDWLYTLAEWKVFSGQDANSLGSPKTVSSVNDIYFYYNDTKVAKVVEIDQPSIDMASTAYYTPITLQPFTSVVLIRDATLGNYYYLSTSGNDSNSGMLMSSPWKTLAKANSTNFADGDKIYMKAGDVWSGETLNFTNATQGWDDEILVTSYGTGNKPTISGFETLTNWTSDGGGIYHATVSNSACNMVTVNGVNTPIARYPKTGYLTFESFSGSSSITDNELAASPSWSGAKAVIRINGFQYAIASVTGHSSHTLSLSGSSTPDATGEYRYFLQGHVNALTAVGDWYLSGTTLYMYFGANSPSNYIVKAAKVAKLVTTDKNYVTMDGIRIEGAIEKGYESSGTHNTVQNCEFEFMGRYGITCAQTTPIIDNNTLNNGNGTAIFMNANSYMLKNNIITNNGIYAGMVEPSTNNYFGINIIAGSGGTCEYNTISNVGYIGISTWGSDNIIRYNKIDNFCSILPDGGGIYANYIGTTYPTGIKVYNNLVLNGGGEGLYSDAANRNTEWYNNTVMNCASGILLNTPVNHNVHDNTFYNCTYGMNFYNWHTNSLTPTGCTVTNNTIVEGSNSTFAVKIGDSTNRDILGMGTVTGNKFYSETGKQTAQFKAYFNPSAPLTNYNLADWRTLTGFESTSTLSTLANFNKLSTIYNDTKVNKDFSVIAKKDLSGTFINGTVTLTPFISKILIDGVVKYVIMNKKLYAL